MMKDKLISAVYIASTNHFIKVFQELLHDDGMTKGDKFVEYYQNMFAVAAQQGSLLLNDLMATEYNDTEESRELLGITNYCLKMYNAFRDNMWRHMLN